MNFISSAIENGRVELTAGGQTLAEGYFRETRCYLLFSL